MSDTRLRCHVGVYIVYEVYEICVYNFNLMYMPMSMSMNLYRRQNFVSRIIYTYLKT
jgi:hypothetical protein